MMVAQGAPDPWARAWDDGFIDESAIAAQVQVKAERPPEDEDLKNVFIRHQVWTDSLVDKFERDLKPMVEAAVKKTVTELEQQLSITDGVIDPTASNDAILSKADAIFMAALNEEGYPELVEQYRKSFSGQLPFLQEMLTAIAKQVGLTTEPVVNFSPTDLKVLNRIELATGGKLDRIFAGAASIAMDRVLFSIAGLPFEQLVATLADQMGSTVATARTWADTAVSSWYRTAASMTFEEIQAATPAALQYRYSGPEDLKTRPFCEDLLSAGKTYTREDIDKMDNGQLPNVFVTCGGYNCRHIFVLAPKK